MCFRLFAVCCLLLTTKKSRAKQRGTSLLPEVFRVWSFRACPSCLAVCFTWPQVALTHHVFQLCLYAARIGTVKQGLVVIANGARLGQHIRIEVGDLRIGGD